MAPKRFNDLLRRMPAIAKAVNAFESESVQLKAYDALVTAFQAKDAEQSAQGKNSGEGKNSREEKAEQRGTQEKSANQGGAGGQKAFDTSDILAMARGEKPAPPKDRKPADPAGSPTGNGPEAPQEKPQAEKVQAEKPQAKQKQGQKESALEGIKRDSNALRGHVAEDLNDGTDHVSKESVQLLKFHGTYQQDDRDVRGTSAAGQSGKSYIYMVRTKIPGGRLTGQQLLSELDLCDEIANSTLRITSRQGLQLHGVVKQNLQSTIQRINEVQLSTLGACGDVNRNVMCCPAPYKSEIYQTVHRLSDEIARHLAPRTRAYHELWVQEPGSDERELVGGGPGEEIDPIYGRHYLPRKFKIGIGFPHDNCVDLYTHDLGLMAVVRDGRIVGYNVLVGGGQGVTPSVKKTFPALAKRMAFVEPDQVLDVVTAVVGVQRDYGNRADRKVARLKYLIHDWGLPKFKSYVEQYYGQPLADPEPEEVYGFNDHLGWDQQGDGSWFYGLNVENGRIQDTEQMQLKSAIREICTQLNPGIHLTTHQSILFTEIAEESKGEIEKILRNHNVPLPNEISTVRRWSMACVARPTCGLAVTESERALPGILDELEGELARLGLSREKFTVRMTGCPNGCARPYNSDVGLVGKTKGKYTILVGGRLLGDRLNFVYQDLVPEREIVPTLVPLMTYFKQERQEDESFGDFCARKGKEDLLAWSEEFASPATA